MAEVRDVRVAGGGNSIGNSFGAEFPRVDRDSAHYWAALAEGRLELQRCSNCARWAWPPHPICSKCHRSELVWERASGKGTVYSWIVTHHAYLPAFASLVPYTIALVRIDEEEDILIPGRLIGAASKVHQGLRVEATFETLTPEVGIMNWKPA